jgi:hypothetical protein
MKQVSYNELESYLYPQIRQQFRERSEPPNATHIVVFQGGGPVPDTTSTALIAVGPGLRFPSLEAACSSSYSDYTAHPLHPVAYCKIPAKCRPVPWANWFDGRMAIRSLPPECVAECSAPEADASEAVDHWVRKLRFKAPPWLVREYLRGGGGYEPSQLVDHQANLRRLLWSWACDCRESGVSVSLYLSR